MRCIHLMDNGCCAFRISPENMSEEDCPFENPDSYKYGDHDQCEDYEEAEDGEGAEE